MNTRETRSERERYIEKFGIPAGVIMLIGWAVATFAFEGPGWVHLFLTLGVFCVIWGIVARGTPGGEESATKRERGDRR
ncbi:MAG: hypothetical protein H7Z74_00535 [Anaerolineae bacterium]|nr:hypothetical protein [Gemmatimonadaceae bacterium]